MQYIIDTSSPQWDDLVHETTSHDVYHTAGYHRLAEWNGEGRPHLFVHEVAETRFLLPLLIRELPDGLPGYDATSVYGYAGSLCTTAEPTTAAVQDFQRELTATLRDLGVVTVFSRLHPYIEQTSLVGLGQVEPTSETVSLDLTIGDAQAQAGYRKSHRRTLRRSVDAGLRCALDKDLDYLGAMSEIYLETMNRTNAGASLRFNEDYFRRMAAELPSEVAHFVCFDADDSVVGASIYLRSEHYLNAHLGGSRSGMGLISPATLETDFARQWGSEAGLRYLNLGGGVGGADDTLLTFKLGFSKSLVSFSTWKWIVDPVRYEQLVGSASDVSGFFPAYRSASSAVSKKAPGLVASETPG
ncbi:MAG: GNAT family N-acetyltransferase [Acidimicrobiales bacterium]